jgi:HSP20 family protein
VSGAEVVISGRRKAPEQTDRRYIVQERFHGGFTRAIALPPGAEPEKMEAVLQDGVLRITVPVAAAQATVTIPVR